MNDEFLRKARGYFHRILRSKHDNVVKWTMVKEYLVMNYTEMADLVLWNRTRPTSFRHAYFLDALFNLYENIACSKAMLINTTADLLIILYAHENDFEELSCSRESCVFDVMRNIFLGKNESVVDNDIRQLTAMNEMRLMKILLNFGLITSLPSDSKLLRKRTAEILKKFIEMVNDREQQYYNGDYLEDFFARKSDDYFCGKTSNRIFFAALGVQAITDTVTTNRYRTHRMTCLKAYFTAVSDAFITIDEVRSLLNVCLSHIRNKSHLVDSYLEIYESLMPESPRSYQPRKLMDLSRTSARCYLSSYSPLPLAIGSVKLPENLKEFMRCDISEE